MNTVPLKQFPSLYLGGVKQFGIECLSQGFNMLIPSGVLNLQSSEYEELALLLGHSASHFQK